MCVCGGEGGDSKNTKSGTPHPCLQERQKKWRWALIPQMAAKCAGVSKAISETPQSNSERQTEETAVPQVGMAVQISVLNTQDGNDLRPRSHSQTLPYSPCSSEGVVQKLVQVASWDKRLLSHLLWDFRVAYLEGSSFS